MVGKCNYGSATRNILCIFKPISAVVPLFVPQCKRAARLRVLSHASYGGFACLSRPTFALATLTLSFCLLLLVLLSVLVSSVCGVGDDLVPSRAAAPVEGMLSR